MQSARPGVAFLIDPASPHRIYLPARARTWRRGAGPAFAVLLVLVLALACLAASGTGLADICAQGDGVACGP